MTSLQEFRYSMEIQRLTDGVYFPAGVVAPGFTQQAREQTAFLGLRRGLTEGELNDAQVREQPVFGEGEDKLIAGVTMSVVGADERRIEKTFGLDLFADFARQQAEGLLKQGHLEKGAKYMFRVRAEPANGNGATAVMAGVKAKVRRKPLPLRSGKLSEWNENAKAIGPMDDDDLPLFITDRALEMSREYSRKPGEKEGGALLLGHLYQQGEPAPEIFGVIDDALEARYAEHAELSLDLTAHTWDYFKAQLELRRTRFGKTHELALAFAHGHNFAPIVKDEKEQPCGECHLKASCPFSSSFYSASDVKFHQALFTRQPFAVGLVWGYTTKMEDDWKVFALDGNLPRRRGIYQVAEHSAGEEIPK